LIELARAGDVEAYGALVRRYQHDARRTAAAIGDLDDADDAAQDAFVRAFGSLHRFRPDAPFRPWLLTIVANVARNQRRSSTRRTRAATRLGEDRAGDDAAPSAEAAALADDHRRGVRTALAALPDRYREVVACRYLLDLSEAETAEVLGLPRGTVKSRLSRALDQLHHTLEREVRGA
jgi:RNA polymerase sigma-70 factor (ECF subfamily)